MARSEIPVWVTQLYNPSLLYCRAWALASEIWILFLSFLIYEVRMMKSTYLIGLQCSHFSDIR